MPIHTAIIIDDEKEPRAALGKVIDKFFSKQIKILKSVSSVKEGVEAIRQFQPSIVFLDIEMPEENGFQLFDYFEETNFEVIFTTAYQKFAIDAIRCSALDYILKPVSHIELKQVLERLDVKKQKENQRFKIETLITNISNSDGIVNRIALPTMTGYEFVKTCNIVHCQADDTYTNVFTNRAECITVSKSLKKVEELLPKSNFFRIHKSHLVNLNFIKSFNRSGKHSVLLENNKELPVSINRSKELIEIMSNQPLVND